MQTSKYNLSTVELIRTALTETGTREDDTESWYAISIRNSASTREVLLQGHYTSTLAYRLAQHGFELAFDKENGYTRASMVANTEFGTPFAVEVTLT